MNAVRRAVGIEQRQSDIFQRAGAGQKVKALEYEAEALAAKLGQFGLCQRRHVDAFQKIMAAGRRVETAENRHQRRFSGARGAHDRHELAALHGKIDAPQRVNLHVADQKGPGEVSHVDDKVRHGVALFFASSPMMISSP